MKGNWEEVCHRKVRVVNNTSAITQLAGNIATSYRNYKYDSLCRQRYNFPQNPQELPCHFFSLFRVFFLYLTSTSRISRHLLLSMRHRRRDQRRMLRGKSNCFPDTRTSIGYKYYVSTLNNEFHNSYIKTHTQDGHFLTN
jgi:hypothetical protein